MSGPRAAPPPAPLLGLTGQPGAGKLTVGLMLQASGWAATSFRAAAEVEVAEHWRIDVRLLTDDLRHDLPRAALAAGMVADQGWCAWSHGQGHDPAEPRSPRWALAQWRAFRLQQRADHWIRHVLMWLATARANWPAAGYVVIDVASDHEATALRAAGGQIVRVHRPRGSGLSRLQPPMADPTAPAQLRADADLVNDGNYYDLALEVRRVVHALALPTTPRSDTR